MRRRPRRGMQCGAQETGRRLRYRSAGCGSQTDLGLMFCFELRHTSGVRYVSDVRCGRASHQKWRPCLNNWTAASKKQKPFASNSKRKLLSVAPSSNRFPIYPQKLAQGHRRDSAPLGAYLPVSERVR